MKILCVNLSTVMKFLATEYNTIPKVTPRTTRAFICGQKCIKNKLLIVILQVKPFCQWEKLDMTALERRKLFCSVTFHVVAITCVVWSLYVLIDR